MQRLSLRTDKLIMIENGCYLTQADCFRQMAVKFEKQPQSFAEMMYVLSRRYEVKCKIMPQRIAKHRQKPSLCRGMTANFDFECFPELAAFNEALPRSFSWKRFLLAGVQNDCFKNIEFLLIFKRFLVKYSHIFYRKTGKKCG